MAGITTRRPREGLGTSASGAKGGAHHMVEEGSPDTAADGVAGAVAESRRPTGRRSGGASSDGASDGALADGAFPDVARPDAAHLDGAPPAGLPRKPTLKTIAALTGLAVPTVSRALGDAPDLKADTKALVRRVAAELGYVPNRAGLRLRTGRTQVISIVMSTEHDMMNNTARLISSLAQTLRDTPFHLNVTYFAPDEDRRRPIRHIVEGGLADAVIFNQTLPEDARAAWLMERGFPFATHGRTVWADRHPWADFDNEAFGALAVRRLARAGRRRLAVIAPPLDQNYAQDMARGSRRAGAEAGVLVRILPGATSDAPGAQVRAAVEAALDGEGLDGLVCASTASAMAAVGALEGRGLALGRELDLVAKEAIPFLSLFRPGIIAVREDVARAGRVLALAAIQAIRDPRAPPLQDLEVPGDEGHDGAARDEARKGQP